MRTRVLGPLRQLPCVASAWRVGEGERLQTMLSMTAWSAHHIATRLASLIRTEDAGVREHASRRLHVPPEELDRFLANESGPPRPEFLASIVRAYGADACWLITGERDIRAAHLAPEERAEVAELLLAVANVLLDPRWARRRTPPSEPRPSDAPPPPRVETRRGVLPPGENEQH